MNEPPPVKKRRRWPWIIGIILVALTALAIYAHWPADNSITISPETTYIIEPVNSDGTINYFQALVDKYSQGVTPENNGAVLLVRALGPDALGEDTADEVLAQLGLTREQLAKDEPHFITLYDFQDLHGDEFSPLPDDMEIYDLIDEIMTHPWSADEYPLAAAWLDANEKPLGLVVESTGRERFYYPLVSSSDPPRLVVAWPGPLSDIRGLARAVTARAMLHLESGDIDGACEDLTALHRLGRQVSRPLLINYLVGVAVIAVGNGADQTMLTTGDLSPRQQKTVLAYLRSIEPIPTLEGAAEGVRFVALDSLMLLRDGDIPQRGLTNEEIVAKPRSYLDWNYMLRTFNYWWGRAADALTEPDYAEHVRKSRELEKAVEKHFDKYNGMEELAKLPVKLWISNLFGRFSMRARTKCVTDTLVALLLPALGKCRTVRENAVAEQRLNLLAAAALCYRSDRGQWPEQLADLSPDYLEEIPQDPFTGEAMKYVTIDEGIKIYSLGPNMTDDGGLDEKQTDDSENAAIVIELNP